MDLKKLATRKMLTAYAALATMVGAGGCAGLEQGLRDNQATINTLNRTLQSAGSLMSGVTGITGSVADWKQVDATKDQTDALTNVIKNNNSNNRRPIRGGRGR